MSADVSPAVGAPTRIASAEVIADSTFAPYCKVAVVVDDYAKLELHLPVSTWTQRLLFSGGIGQQSLAMLSEFVTATWQDLGNRGHEEVFANNYQNRVNYGYRAMHLQVLAAKAIIGQYYDRAPEFSYYNACSEPGREGLMEVQRFPADFDGVAAGCPSINETVNHGMFWSWNVRTNTAADGTLILTEDKLSVLHRAVLAQCDAADGVTDAIISNPMSCHPDLSGVECKSGSDQSMCLNSAQVHVALEIYKGAHDGLGGKLLPVGALPGSELAWTQVIVPSSDRPRINTELIIKYSFSTPPLSDGFKLADMKFDRATFDAVTQMRFHYDATDPDLAAFARAGHKLLLWQGLGDATVLPAYAILYYTALQQQMGATLVNRFARLYLLPGVYHCGGGEGPAISDFLTPLMLWVERGIAPGMLMAAHSSPAMTRPIYPYPYNAKYTGTGSVSDAANFVKGPARPAPIREWSNWFGSNFYQTAKAPFSTR